jgi:hypothetical protein
LTVANIFLYFLIENGFRISLISLLLILIETEGIFPSTMI